MKKMILATAMALGCTVAVSAGAFSPRPTLQPDPSDSPSTRDGDANTPKGYETAQPSRVLIPVQEVEVLDIRGQELGSANAVLADPSTGRVDFVLISTGEKHLPVPIEAFRYDHANRVLLLAVEKDKLDDAPEARSDTPYDREFAGRVGQYYGIAPPFDDDDQGGYGSKRGDEAGSGRTRQESNRTIDF
jgi:hypothetical protein